MAGQSRVPRIPILMYHSISSESGERFRQFAMSPERFAQHLAYLQSHSYTPITVSRYVELISGGGGDLPDRPVVLTFDDGFADFYTDALPELRRHDFVATLYVATDYVGGTSLWLGREGEAERSMLSWSQLREIAENGIECGAHTCSHPQLDVLPDAAIMKEVVECKVLLEDRLGRRICTFAYPFGFQTERVRRMVRAAGYTSACAVAYAMSSPRDDRFALSRLIVTGDMSIDRFARLLAGHGSPLVPAYRRIRAKTWQIVRRAACTVHLGKRRDQ